MKNSLRTVDAKPGCCPSDYEHRIRGTQAEPTAERNGSKNERNNAPRNRTNQQSFEHRDEPAHADKPTSFAWRRPRAPGRSGPRFVYHSDDRQVRARVTTAVAADRARAELQCIATKIQQEIG